MKCQNCGNNYEGTACPTCNIPNPAMGQSIGAYPQITNVPPVNQPPDVPDPTMRQSSGVYPQITDVPPVNQPPYVPYPTMGQYNRTYPQVTNVPPMGQPPYAPYPNMQQSHRTHTPPTNTPPINPHPRPPYATMKPKKTIYKKWWFYTLIAVMIMISITVIANDGNHANQNPNGAFTSYQNFLSTTPKEPSTKSTFVLGETATSKDSISLTMTDVTESFGTPDNKPMDGQVWITAHFTIENDSNNYVTISSLAEFTATIDGTEATMDFNTGTNVSESPLIGGFLLPGEQLTGRISYSAPINYKTLKISYNPPFTTNSPDSLIFVYSK